MKIIQLIFLVLLIPGLSSCAQIMGPGGTLSASDRSNEVAEANLNLGVAYMQRGDYEKALDKLNKALAADTRHTPTYNALGLLYQKLGKPEQAEQYFKQALSINQNDAHTLNNYGQFLCDEGRYDQAQEAFLKAASNPLYEVPEIPITNAGTCALENNQPDMAEQHFRNALDKNPKVPVALIQMSQLSYDQGNYLSARGYLQRYLEVAKHTAHSLWLGIQIEQNLGDKNTLSSYALLLKNNFPNSREAGLLLESGFK
ncbi:MAG: type IV pilus biogenesis/stability protein PilW [Gammaproteobacteria bacterium RIFCSPLOWO2_02_FULL_47_50]|jgi:type IV pilus assembly protein PilF|nr:MAG: type IV pilus biogenesis/stability protein PilW [Gammaproteobacteria bacterium RIFCSPLOWO2_01_FULL_47_190]OGT71432.1 MAG: type IV pilus biogenesis/stability protein PilW [Gammaproteobacteria bacterium RIFCSPLOWO2_12_47_11]OGT78165.1 MAG: type IV pilus biogenesis/stability protein PilW [Gammaproteobacteria bacterium RIFCSPLOWO2_02_FULL_47_50]OGT83881.1 MAG: type IV pilus biogenesis/stability protein PilW [Gammaproteobacteria bacterium RIFCSPLOWO2_12_FULL_47_76]